MPSSAYYRRQATTLLSMALAASDPDLAERLRAKAELFLAQAELPDDSTAEFKRLVDGYNDDQMRGA
jgi:hypothetical protein